MSTEISGSIKTDISINEDTYDVTVNIPTGKPAAASPYELMIFNKTMQADLPPTEDVPTLLWMEAYYTNPETDTGAPDNMYLSLSPPASILPNGTSFAIKNLSINFATGAYVAAAPTDGPKGTKPAQ